MQNLGINTIIEALPRLLDGVGVTLKIALISLGISIVLGLIIGILMTQKNVILKAVLRIFLEAFRLIHPVVWLFVIFFGLPYVFGIDTDSITVSIVVFSIWGSFEIGDLVRGYITSLPKSQFETSAAIGLTKSQTYLFVLLPQIFIRLLPSIVNLATRLIKTTTLVYLIGVPELLKVSQSIIQITYTKDPTSLISFSLYLFLLLLYFIICFPLSLCAKALEKKFAYFN